MESHEKGFYSVDSTFDFAAQVFGGIHRGAQAAYRPDDEEAGTIDSPLTTPVNSNDCLTGFDSPLSPLTDSDPSRPASPASLSTPNLIMPFAAPQATAVMPPTSSDSQIAPKIATPVAPPTRLEKRKAKKKQGGRRNEKKKKENQTEHDPNPKLALNQVQTSVSVSSTYSAEGFSIASTGYIGQREQGHSSTYKLDQVIGPKSRFKNLILKKWDGRTSIPILDQNDRILGVCAGKPHGDDTWNNVQIEASSLLENARPKIIFSTKETKHRRGHFSVLNIGISHGGGQPYPKILNQNPLNESAIESLMQAEVFKRISGFATGAFSTWAPRLYKYQTKYISNLIEHDQDLRRKGQHPKPEQKELHRNWPNTPWAAAALNFGPQTVCYKHADFGNLAYGWCAITALGEYDHTKGGHLILWDLGLVIEFPPGSTILIPSSAIHHSNVRIQKGERRYSLTQFSAGGIFRWIDNGYKKMDEYLGAMELDEQAAVLEKLSKQLEEGLALYSTVAELEALRKSSILELEALRKKSVQKTTAV